MAHVYEGSLDGSDLRIGIVVARFNDFITKPLLDGALRTLLELGVPKSETHVAWVPGAFEIPSVGMTLFEELDCHAVIALGAVIRGETAHFDYVCRAVTDGVLQVGLDTGRPFIFGVLTVDDTDQAHARSGDGERNKGREAALAAVEVVRLGALLGEAGSDDS